MAIADIGISLEGALVILILVVAVVVLLGAVTGRWRR